MNLARVDAKMNSPDDFLVRAVRSSSQGHGSERSKSLLRLRLRQLLLEVQSDILVDAGQFDLVQQEDLSERFQEGEAKSCSNAGFRSSGDEELDGR
jgi:hypothetical protein